MKSPFHQKRRKLAALWIALAIAISCPIAVNAQDSGSGSNTSAWWSAFIDALQSWFSGSGSSGGSSSDPTTTNPETDVPATVDSSTTPDSTDTVADSAPVPDATPTSSGTPDPNALAQAIARDSGGHADQYNDYSERLAVTLARLSPAQRARIFSN